VLLLVLVGLVSTGLFIAADRADLLEKVENDTIDARFSIRGAQRAPEDIVIVKVDDVTFQRLDRQWPFPRAVIGRVIRRIARQAPAAIAVDVQFSESSARGRGDDIALLEAINGARGRTVFALTETSARGDVRFLGSTRGTRLLRQVGSRPASALFPPEPGGYIRRLAPEVEGLEALAIVAARVAGSPVEPSQIPGGPAWIDFLGPAGTFSSVSFATAHGCDGCEELEADAFRDKIVVIGATAPSLQDLHPTPMDGQMPGPEVQANAIATARSGFPLRSAPGWLDVALIVAMGLVVPLLALRFGPLTMTAAAVGLAALLAVGAQVAFNSGSIVSFVSPLGALTLSFAGSLAVRLVSEAFERTRTRDLFARFVPENVVDEVLASADGLRLGGVQRDGTVMFVDLRGFTTLAESLAPARVIETLNHYLSEMSDAILDHGGTLVAYMGDGIMAVFGAPLEQADHADRALAAATEMIEVRLPRFNRWLQEEGLGEGFTMGIGLNSGHVMSGHVGSERRVEYTAVGDTTNTAARIEQMTKGTDHMLLLAESTRAALVGGDPGLVFVEEREVRGREGTIRLWTLPGARVPSEPAAAERTA
jgi:adenylate cyclase